MLGLQDTAGGHDGEVEKGVEDREENQKLMYHKIYSPFNTF